jgi:hypothetical protein
MRLLIPYDRGDLVSLLYERAIVNRETYQPEGICIEVHVPRHLTGLVQPYQLESSPS